MKKTIALALVFSILASVLLFGCTSEDKELKTVIKVIPQNTTERQNITLNLTPANNSVPAGNVTANVTANITNTTNASVTNQTSNATVTVPGVQLEVHLKNLSVEILNQFEGNSILITTPKNKKVVIDGGTNKDGLYLVKYIIGKGIYKIDYVFASNARDNNVGGLDSLILNYNETSPFYSGLQYTNNNAYKNYITYANLIAHSLTVINKSQDIELDDSITFSAFVPFDGASLGSPEDDTIVFKIKYNDASILLLSDCTQVCLEKLNEDDLKADIVKANNAIPEEMLAKISPKVIILNKNPDNLTNTTAKVYSKADGIVKIVSDGDKYYISTVPQ